MRAGRRSWTFLVLLACAGALAACGGEPRTSRPPASAAQGPTRAAAADVRYATFPSITRLTPTIDVEPAAPADGIQLQAARGEREGGQLVVWATQGSPRVVLETTALRGPRGARLPAGAVVAYVEQPMEVEKGSPAGRSGTYVDPLLPARGRALRLRPDQRLLAWVDVAVPTGATPGQYEGSLLVRPATRSGAADERAGEPLATVPLRVRVRHATLPHVPTLASHVGFDASQVIRFEGVAAGSVELRDVTEAYARELAKARLSIGDVVALPPGALPGHRGLPGDGAYLERVFGQRGVASVRIPFYMDHPFPDPLGRDRPRAVAYLRAAARWARAHGWADRAYVFAIDEPGDDRAGEVRELHELLREADPSLRLLVTREASAAAFRGSVDIWAPNVSPTRFRPADVQRARRAGRETWWYPSITTWQPYPTLFIDDLRPSPRALGWLAWRMGVRGFLYWTATHWHEVEDPYRDPATYRETNAVGNGDGVLLYPGAPAGTPGRPVPSVRLLQLRDGIDDHDLLVMATCAADARGQARLRALARAAAPAMDRIDPTVGEVEALRSAAFDLLDDARADADPVSRRAARECVRRA